MTQNDSTKKLTEAAGLLRDALHRLVRIEGAVHAETLVAAAARMAGTMLFRSLPMPPGLEPGRVVTSDEANTAGPVLVQAMFAVLRQLGHDRIDEQGLGGATQTAAASRLSLAQTQALVEPWCGKIREVSGLTHREMAAAAAIATALVIHDCRNVLDVHAGCAIAIHGMVESSKTVPHEAAAAN